jgi:hypothetical protein
MEMKGIGNSILGLGIFPGFVFLPPQKYRIIARVLVHVLDACVKTPDRLILESLLAN